ncbi:MAG: hypothetical protein ACN6O8_06080, partial [Achromobacter sp.]|uniref:hypothetical protein n=1 Tax=Achromobacter sp. TaxID=134375 RepID=UPI003D04F285
YTLQDLDCQATLRTNPDTNDEGITDPSEPAPEGNCSRQIDYTFRLTGPTVVKYGANLYEVRVDKNQYSALNGYCVGYRGEHLYTHAAYFWPMNLRDLDGNSIDASHSRQFPLGEYEVYYHASGLTRFDEDFQGFALTVYGYFGYWYDKSRRRTARLDVKLYDQYGNCGNFHVSTDDMPEKYAEFKTWKPVKEELRGEIPTPQFTGGNGYVRWNTRLHGNFGKDRGVLYICGKYLPIITLINGICSFEGRADYTNSPSTYSFVAQDQAPVHKGAKVELVDASVPQRVGPYFLVTARAKNGSIDIIFGASWVEIMEIVQEWGNVHPIWVRQSIVMQALSKGLTSYIRTSEPVAYGDECVAKNYVQGDETFEFTPVDYYLPETVAREGTSLTPG